MGKFSAYKVQLASLPDGSYEQDFHIDMDFFKNMENSDILSCDVDVKLNMVKKNDAYDMTFHCSGMMEIPCDRCLDPLPHPIDTEYHVVVKYGEAYDDGADNLLVIPYSNAYLNVAYILYDTLLLTIPLRHVHPLGKCNRAMVSALHKHRSNTDDEEVNEAMDEVDAGIDIDTDGE